MTSNHSLFNMRLLRETMRRNIWAIALSFVGFFFCLPLPIAMTIQKNMADMSRDHEQIARTREYTLDAVRMMLSGENPYVKTGICIMAVLCGIALFSYLHSRQRVDFYHALPMRRGALFVQNYTAGLLTVLPAFIIMYALSCFTAAAMGMGEVITVRLVMQALAVHTLFFWLIYTVSVLATVLTGNTILAVLLDGWLLFSLTGIAAIVYGLNEMFLQTWGRSSTLDMLMRRASPVVLYYSLGQGGGEDAGMPLFLGIIAVTLAVGVLSFVLFARRKSESAGAAIAFEGLKLPLKSYMVLFIALVMGLIMSSIGGTFWVWFGLVAGAVLGHIIIEMIYHMDVRAAFKNGKTMLILSASAVVLVIGVQQDVMGYDKWIPSENRVQAVGFRTWASRRDNFAPWVQGMDSADAVLTDPACIAAVLELAQAGVAEVKSGRLYEDSAPFVPYEEVWIGYELKGGHKAERRYRIQMTDEIWAAIDSARFTEDYMRRVTPLFSFDLDKIADNMVLEVRTHADPSEQVGAELRAPAQTHEIIQTLREESLGLTQQMAAATVPVLRIDVRYTMKGEQERYHYEQRLEYIPVYPSYARTLALLEQYGGVTPRALTADDLKSITIERAYDEKYKEKVGYGAETSAITEERDSIQLAKPPVVITDRAEMEAFLAHALTEPVAISCDHGFLVEGSENYRVYATYKNNRDIQLYYLDGKFPEALCASYFS